MNKSYRKILLTHDGSKFSATAMPHAIAVAQAFHSKITVLHVIDAKLIIIPAVASTQITIGTREILEDLSNKERKAAEQMMTKFTKKLDQAGLTNVTAVIEEGDPRDKIVSIAKKHACDLIVMATHGRTGLKGILLGSVADYVVNNAPCPVLLIHPQK